MSNSAWGFFGILITQAVVLVTLLINRKAHIATQRQLSSVERHVNNVEVDIDHDSEDVTLGQRLKRMEQDARREFSENSRVHDLLARAIAEQAVASFRVTYSGDNHNPAMILVHDPDSALPWTPVWVNADYEEIVGLTLKQAQQQEYTSYIHPDDLDRVLKATEVMMESRSSLSLNYRYTHPKTGEQFILNLYGEPVRSIDDSFFALLITFRKEAL